MKIIRFNEAETYEPEKAWKRVSLCNETNLSVEYFVTNVLLGCSHTSNQVKIFIVMCVYDIDNFFRPDIITDNNNVLYIICSLSVSPK